MDKRDIVRLLTEIATLLELKGENAFKIRAYQNAARAIGGLTDDVDELVRAGQLTSVKGVGKAIAATVEGLVTDGSIPYLAELRGAFPRGVVEMLRIPGLGPKKVRVLYEELGIASVGELEYACDENRLTSLKGFGAKTQERALEGIALIRRNRERVRYDEALRAAAPLLEALTAHPASLRAELAGSLRRRRETVKDVDILVASDDPTAIMAATIALPGVASVIGHGETKTSVRLGDSLQVDVRVVSDAQFPYALHHFTGSKEHNVKMRGRAQERGLKMNEYGLFRTADDSLVAVADEAGLFAALDLAFIPPEMREDRGEVEAAEAGELPQLIEYGAEGGLAGTIHNHTDWSDGRNTLEQMVAGARALGWSYIGISDHSQAAGYANGLGPDRVAAQHEAIDALNAELGLEFRVLKGIEADILPDGTVDYDAALRATFDYVIASVHSRFKMSRDEMTRRVLRALEDPTVVLLGHPTGRLLQARDGYDLDLDAVIDSCASRGIAIEINASPARLDLDWRLLRAARDRGARFFINSDAHSVDALAGVTYGVGVARKGWLRPEDIINSGGVDAVLSYFDARRKPREPRT